MRFLRALLGILIIAVTIVAPPTTGQPQRHDPDRARMLVHLLDYLGADYAGAVENGVVIDSLEYAEMAEFGVLVDSLVKQLVMEGALPGDRGFLAMADSVPMWIRDLVDPTDLARDTRRLRSSIVEAAGLPVAPTRWPSLASGETLFGTYCATCHGVTGAGDGPASIELDPKPANLAAGARVAGIAPFQAYNTIRLGVAGTGMVGFPQLTEDEAWDLAFFVKSLEASQNPIRANSDAALVRRLVTLAEVASLADADLERLLDERGADHPAAAVAAIRAAGPPSDMAGSLDIAEDHLAAAEAAYRDGQTDVARELSVAAYLEGIEPVEPVLGASDPALVARLETAMMAVRSAIQARRPADEVSAAVAASRAVIVEARALLGSREHGAWFTFGMALSILLREALEAFLIIIAMLGVIRASGQTTAARWVHTGWIAALLVGLAGWFLVDALLALGAARRELLEGAISILAVVVLLSVGFWLHDMTSVRKWKAFLDTRIRSQLGRGSLFGLAAFSFFAVFREAFESVLFLAALSLDGGEGAGLAIGSATALSLAIMLVLGVLVVRYSTRLPVKHLFRYASVLIVMLAIVLAGKGVHALQEAGSVSASISWIPWRIELLGIYPTLETLIAQLLVVGTVVVLWLAARRSEMRLV